jgi:iron(III) transport system ATP-binding protein
VRGLVKSFGRVRAVDGIGFSVRRGEFLTLLGPSGCGKTTTLMSIAGLHLPDAGEILLEGEPLTSVARRLFVPPERRGIGMVFQSYAVWPHMTVAQNVAYPLEVRKLPRGEIRERVPEALRRVQLLDFMDKPATQLSGGQQQRVALARAIVFNPRLLLFDEPLSNLDAKLREQMRVELTRLQRALGITSVYVTHDQAEALVLSDRILVMNHGRLEQAGDPRTVYGRPANRFVSQFIGGANLLEGRLVEAEAGRGLAEVRGGPGPCRVRCVLGAGLLPGDEVCISVRPEHVRLAMEPPAGGELNGFEGQMVAAIFLGNYTDCRVRWGQHEWKVHVGGERRRAPGDRVWLVARPEHCLCLAW